MERIYNRIKIEGDKIKKLLDVKTIAILTLLITLEIITILVFIKENMDLIQIVFVLFSNIITMVFTYFFTKKNTSEDVYKEDINPNEKIQSK